MLQNESSQRETQEQEEMNKRRKSVRELIACGFIVILMHFCLALTLIDAQHNTTQCRMTDHNHKRLNSVLLSIAHEY